MEHLSGGDEGGVDESSAAQVAFADVSAETFDGGVSVCGEWERHFRVSAEDHDADGVSGAELVQSGSAGGGELLQVLVHAAAEVEEEEERKRLAFVVKGGDGAGLAVVEDAKIFAGEIVDDAVLLLDLGIDADVSDAGLKKRLFGFLRKRTTCDDEKQDAHDIHYRWDRRTY